VTWAAFTSEWTKLKRKTLLLSTFLGLAVAASLFVILIFSQAPATGSGGGLPSLQQLARPNGLIVGVDRAVMLLGIVAFGIAAAQSASEYSLGTLRQLLVRQPRRVTLLVGKMLGVITFLLLAFVFAAVVAFVVAVVAMHARHGSTTAWFNGTGMTDLFRALGNISLAVVGYSVLGLVIGLFVRSAVFAVILGFAWMIAVENIITRIVPSTEKWLPGMALEAVATGGGEGVNYSHGIFVAAVYLVVALAFIGDIRAYHLTVLGHHLTTAQLSDQRPLIITVVIAVGLALIALWLWMARAAGRGRNWARILSTVLFGLATLGLTGNHGVAQVFCAVLTWLTGLAAVWLLWRPASSAFFKPQALDGSSAAAAGDADRRH